MLDKFIPPAWRSFSALIARAQQPVTPAGGDDEPPSAGATDHEATGARQRSMPPRPWRRKPP